MLQIESFLGGYDDNFTYLIWCRDTRSAALVDAATPVRPIRQIIEEKNLNLAHILLTHTHGDHLTYLMEWLQRYPRLQVLGHQRPESSHLPSYRGLADGTSFSLGCCGLEVIETPGHYPDCVCWYERQSGSLFTGDTVFVGRTGRTLSPGSSLRQLYHSVYERILTLPTDTVVYPGHDYGSTPTISLGELRKSSDFFHCGNEAEFMQVMARFERNR
ncbi:MAG: MBL fold metallo-hydrolase [Fidelibacterota bacterium]|nr:MAG: MBL fold metallo-hydrolase [Candidatus Neomarinimicrobiota bacterium]